METENTSRYNSIQLIKRRFFAMRNGVIADSLRKGGSIYRMIFGLNLPQIVEIAADQTPSRVLAEALWADMSTRESRLLAPMVYPIEEMSREDALRWLETAAEIETADVMCHRLLRRHPAALEIALSRGNDELPASRYTARRLMVNLLALSTGERARELARLFKPFAVDYEAERPSLRGVTRRLAEEIAWLLEEE